ncbi:MAG: aryl-sulfate sulfotransferase [Bacteroidetes bacterium]|nr:aryl-sulfate sulfotransferase [Bacteroidota bacterium]
MSESKVSILQNSSAGNLISKIDSTSNSLDLVYENGFIAHIPKNYLTSVAPNLPQWQTLFSFTDGTFINAFCIGSLNLNDSIKVNPFGTAPLCALASFRMPVQGKFNIIVHGKPNGGVNISHHFSNYGYEQQLPILGLYDNYANQVEIQFLSSNGVIRATQMVTLQTDAVPNKPTLTIKKNSLSPIDASIYSLSASGPWGFDQKGEIRWYYTGDFFWSYGKLKNGNLIVSSAINTKIGQMSPILNEISMLGEVVRTYNVPNFQTHDIVEMPNGNLMIGTNSSPSWGNGAPELDAIAEIDRSSGNIIKTWDFNTILDPTRLALPDSGVPNDWVHINSVFYNSNDNSIIVSCRSQSAVVKIDYSTSQIKWILANHNFWNTQLSQYLLTPVDSKGNAIAVDTIDFWPYGQHNATQLQNGNVMLYDDGDYRGYYDNQNAPLKSYTRGVEYKLDEKNMTIQLYWSFDNSKTIFTQYTGSITQFDATNTRMIGYMDGATNAIGESPKILEVDSQNNTVFEVNVNLGKFYYRALKMDLYGGLH